MTEKRFKHKRNRLGMQFICYDDKEELIGTFADVQGVTNIVELLNELHDEKQSVIKWIDRKIEEIKPYNSELCRATLLELKEFLE